MNYKVKYLIVRCLSASIDLMIFGIFGKILEPLIGFKNMDGEYSLHAWTIICLYYSIQLSQDLIFGKTIGKRIFKLEMGYVSGRKQNNIEKYFRIILRRVFDFIDLVCPFIYFGMIFFSKKNQKLGELISGVIIYRKGQ